LLTVENLSFSFRQLKLFTQLSFNVDQGDLVVISGPNGCGKSTLVSLITGSRKPDHGQITYSSREFPGEYLGAECNHLFIKRSAEDNLKLWSRLGGTPLSQDRLFSELKIWGLAHPYFSSQLPVARFSTGMKRRLALARVGLSPKNLWLLDEPLFGLDVEAVAIFQKRLEQHVKNNGAAIIVSHDDRLYRDLPHRRIDLLDFKEEKNEND
jgi:ABC-type transport system involved in cytochrome c biogenesis ATPase subunit